jgi:hypothetical protein
MVISCFLLLNGNNSADPLIARERGKIFPRGERRRIRNEGLSQILRQFVYHAAGYLVVPALRILDEGGSWPNCFFLGHATILSNSSITKQNMDAIGGKYFG